MENIIETNLLNWENTKINGFSSKQLIELKNGGLKLIKVETASTYPMHNHPEKTEFIYVLDGLPEIIIGNIHYSGKQKDFFILPKTVNHSIINKGDKDCILLIGEIKE